MPEQRHSEDACRAKLLFVVAEDWYFESHRLRLAMAAKASGYDVTVATRLGDAANRIRECGIRCIPLNINRAGVNPITEVRSLAALFAIYRSERPDIVHHVAIKPVVYGSVAARLVGIRAVVNAVAGLGWLFTARRRIAWLVRPLARALIGLSMRNGIVIVQNQEDFDFFAARHVPQRSMRLIRGAGVDIDQFPYLQEYAKPPVVLFASRLLRSKGIEVFVQAAKQLVDEGVEARFVVAGKLDGGNRDSINESELRQWHASGVVEYVGWSSDIPRLLASCSVFCLPSFYGEGVPKALIEAAAAGRPIVTTDMPGCRDIVHDGDNGILVPPEDVEAVVKALRLLIAEPRLRERMGLAGRQRVIQEFTLGRVVAQTLEVYDVIRADCMGSGSVGSMQPISRS